MRAQSHKVNRRQAFAAALRDTSIIKIDVYGGGHGAEGIFYAVRNPGRISISLGVFSELQKLAQDFARLPNHFQLPLTQRDTGGAINEVRVVFHGSPAGGTNALTQLIVALKFAERMEKKGCPVSIQFSLTDSVCFAGLGKSVHENASCAIKAIVDEITSPKTGAAALTVWGLRLIGLPPVGTNVSLRRELLLLDKQAWGCPAMLEYRQGDDPNMANTSPFGNICHTSSDYFTSIASTDIAALNAREYHSAIVQALENIYPIPSLIKEIESNRSLETYFRSPIDAIVEACDSQTVDEMLRATILSDGRHSFDFQAVNSEGETYDCELIGEHFVAPPTSPDEAIHQITTVTTIRAVLSTEESEVENRLARLEAKIQKQQRAVIASYRRVQDASIFVASKKVKAVRLGVELRRSTDQRFVCLSMRDELKKSIAALTQEYSSQVSRLKGVVSVLDRVRKKGRTTERHDLYFFNGVDNAFPDLLTLPALDHDRRVQVRLNLKRGV